MRATFAKLPTELASSLQQAYSLNPRLNAFTAILSPADALVASSAASKHAGPLAGVPIAVKDVFCTKDLPTTAASRMLRDYVSPFEATVVERLKAAGGVIMGKTNMDEFGMGALASDTGGSTRLPAAYCGVVGLKPSYGLLSRWGMLAYASSLDCVGIMAKEVRDVQTTFGVLSAYDRNDPTSAPVDARARIESSARWTPRSSKTDLTGLRIGVPAEYFLADLSPEVLPAFRRVLEQLRSMGATLSSVSIPSTPLSLSAYYVIASAEASSNLARFDGVRFGFRSSLDVPSGNLENGERSPLYAATRSEGFGDEVKKRILLGTHALSAEAFDNYYLQSQRIRQLLRTEFDDVFRSPSPLHADAGSGADPTGVDVLLHPSAISTAPLLNSHRSATAGYVQDILNVPASLAGLPAVSVPAGRAEDGWPVGVQVVAQWGADSLVLAVGEAIESIGK
ncbi:hypothetical protein RQP46_009386 [Phenoliferia psychrophenolica]